jgi:K+-transporting ATPase ATPase B chain
MALLSVDLGRGTRRFQRFVTLGGAKPSGEPPKPRGVLDPELLRAAIPHAFRKLDPRLLIKNPVMFVVEITAVLVTLIAIAEATGVQTLPGSAGLGFEIQIAISAALTAHSPTSARPSCGRATSSSSRRARPSPVTATSSRASASSTRLPSPASPRPS